MSSERDLPVYEGKWGAFSLWSVESLPPGTMVVLLGAHIVSSSDATFPQTTTKVAVNEPFTLRLTLSPLLPDMDLVVTGQAFSVRMDPA